MNDVLPDLLRPGLDIVFCGTAVATASDARGHYYSGPGNKFWQLLYDTGFTPTLLTPREDVCLPDLGIGLTDLVKNVAQSHDRGLDFGGTASTTARLEAAAPRWIAFNGLKAARQAAIALGQSPNGVSLGRMEWTVGASRVYVLPSSSGAHAIPYAHKFEWWGACCIDVKAAG